MDKEQINSIRRIVDYGFKSSHIIQQHGHEASKQANQIFFIMNGASILAVMTFLGVAKLDDKFSIIFILLGLSFFCIGLLQATLFILAEIRNSEIAQEHLLTSAIDQESIIINESIAKNDTSLFEKMTNDNKKFQEFSNKQSKKSIRAIRWEYAFFIFGIGLVADGLLYLKFTEYSFLLWLVGPIFSSLVYGYLYYKVEKIFALKFDEKINAN
jgi:hypothetical protein